MLTPNLTLNILKPAKFFFQTWQELICVHWNNQTNKTMLQYALQKSQQLQVTINNLKPH